MAEGYLRAQLAQKWQKRVVIQSAGTFLIKGAGADPFAILVSSRNGVDLSRHKSQGISRSLIAKANLILVMGFSHLHFFEGMDSEIINKIFLLKEFGRPAEEIDKLDSSEISDPIGGSLDDFLKCSNDIESEIKRALPLIDDRIMKYFEGK